MPEITETYVEDLHNRVAHPMEDGTPVVIGHPYRAECDGVTAVASSPEGAREMVERILARRPDPASEESS